MLLLLHILLVNLHENCINASFVNKTITASRIDVWKNVPRKEVWNPQVPLSEPTGLQVDKRQSNGTGGSLTFGVTGLNMTCGATGLCWAEPGRAGLSHAILCWVSWAKLICLGRAEPGQAG